MKLVKLPNSDYVNPDYVTSIEYLKSNSGGNGRTKVWVIGNAGYHTYSIDFDGDRRDELVKLINN